MTWRLIEKKSDRGRLPAPLHRSHWLPMADRYSMCALLRDLRARPERQKEKIANLLIRNRNHRDFIIFLKVPAGVRSAAPNERCI
jgi:hypothetical protein